MAMTQEVARRAQLQGVLLRSILRGDGKKDMSHVPWDDQVSYVRLSLQGSRHPTGTRGSPRLVACSILCSETCTSSNTISTRT